MQKRVSARKYKSCVKIDQMKLVGLGMCVNNAWKFYKVVGLTKTKM